MPTFPYSGYPDNVAYPAIPRGTTVVNVSGSAALTTALANAAAGQRIVLASGTYSGAFTLTGKTGTASAGISIEAGSTGGAIFAAGSTFTVAGSAYLTLQGLAFPYELPSGGTIVKFTGTSNRCRLTRCLFGPATVGAASTTRTVYVLVTDDAEHIRVDHCELRNKAGYGNPIIADGNAAGQANRHLRIDHNYIHHIAPEAVDEKEPVQLGVVAASKSLSYSVVERNVFADCAAGLEVLALDSSGNQISGNTFLRCTGGVVYRHGTGGVLTDNYVVDDGTAAPPPPPPSGGTQTLGVGGVATPAGAILATSDTTSALNITISGTASNPRVYDGQGHTVGRVTFDGCQYVVVQNYNIRSGNQYGVVFDEASNVTLQNCDISNVRVSGDGDLNCITLWGGTKVRIKYNTAINFVSGDPGGSHTDWLQTWVSSSHPNAASNVEITGNRCVGPANPSRDNSVPSIHQWIMIEGQGRGGNSGGSGHQTNWYVADNYVSDSWNQAVKVDAASTGFNITRNNFAGSSDRVIEDDTGGGIKFWSDNQITGSYGSVGMSITSGSGPATVPF